MYAFELSKGWEEPTVVAFSATAVDSAAASVEAEKV